MAHKIRSNHIIPHSEEDLALVCFIPHNADANEVIKIGFHTLQDHDTYYTIGQGLIRHNPQVPAQSLQGTALTSISKTQYRPYEHGWPLRGPEVALLNGISSICNGDSGKRTIQF